MKILLPHEYQRLPANWVHVSSQYPELQSNIWPPANTLVMLHFANELRPAYKFCLGYCVCLDSNLGRFDFNIPPYGFCALSAPTAWMPLTFIERR